MNRIEVVLGSLALVSLSADMLGVPVAGAMMIASFSALAVFYMYFAYPVFNLYPLKTALYKAEEVRTDGLNRFLSHFIGMSIALVIIGFMFKLMRWPNATSYLMIGVSSLTLMALFLMIKYNRNKTTLLRVAVKRIAIFDLVGIVFLTA